MYNHRKAAKVAEKLFFLLSAERAESKTPQANGQFLLDLYDFKPYKHAQHKSFVLSVLPAPWNAKPIPLGSTERTNIYFLCVLCVLSEAGGETI